MNQLPLQWLDEATGNRVLVHPPAPRARLLARKSDPVTSVIAAERADFKARDIAKINAALRDSGAMTAYEIAGVTGLDHVAVSRRMKEMVERKLVRDPAKYEYRTRPSPKGRPCIVWEAMP